MTRRRLIDDPARRDLIATMLVSAVQDDQQVESFRAYAMSGATAAEFVSVTTRLGEPAAAPAAC